MKKLTMIKSFTYLLIFCSLFISCNQNAPTSSSQIKVSGAMRNVMKKGDLSSSIYLDTIRLKEHLYGIGPGENLVGELLIIDGKSYKSSVDEDGAIRMEESFLLKSPFFVYTNQREFEAYRLPNETFSINALESFLNEMNFNNNEAFVFKLKGTFQEVDFHIQNLPEGSIIKSHEDAHVGQAKFSVAEIESEIIGFFSQEHQGIFIHHDALTHLHFIDADRSKMGHVDHLLFDASQVVLYLPKNN